MPDTQRALTDVPEPSPVRRSWGLVALFPLVFFLGPRPAALGGMSTAYVISSVVIVFILLAMLRDVHVDRITARILAVLYVMLALMVASSVWVHTPVNLSTTVYHIAKAVFWVMVMMYATTVGGRVGPDGVVRGLLVSAKIVLLAQLVASADQFLGTGITSYLYSDVKASSALIRATGTVANPNMMAWTALQMTALVLSLGGRARTKYLWTGLGVAMVIASGSRSTLLAMMASVIILGVLNSQQILVARLLRVFLLGAAAMGAVYWFLISYRYQFRYLAELLTVLQGNGFDQINSVRDRYSMWTAGWDLFTSVGGIGKWIIGLGPGSLVTADNNYLYSLVNYGALFLVASVALYIGMAVLLFRKRWLGLGGFAVQYVLLVLIMGYQVETIAGWFYGPPILYIVGLAIGACGREGLPGGQGRLIDGWIIGWSASRQLRRKGGVDPE